MDGKYAKYIPSTYGFITKLEIVGDELHVHTKETAKGEPHKYPLGETISEFSERLETQYKLIIDKNNLQIIKNDLIKDAESKLYPLLQLLSAIAAILSLGLSIILTSSLIIGVIGAITIYATAIVSKKIISNKISKDFDEEMGMIKSYLSSRTNIEKMSKRDPNVTGNLKPTTINRIEINNELNKNGTIQEIFDITLLDDLMRKAKTKKELKKILTNYMICVALRQPQVFVDPPEKNSLKEKKVRVRSKYEEHE